MATTVAPPTRNIGKVIQVIGPVLDVEFEAEKLPEIYNALRITAKSDSGTDIDVTSEVQQHIGRNQVRAVAMSATDGVVRGMEVLDTGTSITVPVGEAALGRILNVLGQPVDDGPAIPDSVERWPIHRMPPKFANLEPKSTRMVLETATTLGGLGGSLAASLFSARQLFALFGASLLLMAVLVAEVSRSRGDADGEEGEQRGDEVRSRVRRLGQEAEAVRRDAGAELQRDQGRRCDHGDERCPPLRRHLTGSSGQTTTSRRREKWQRGSPFRSTGEIDASSISASARWSNHGSW